MPQCSLPHEMRGRGGGGILIETANRKKRTPWLLNDLRPPAPFNRPNPERAPSTSFQLQKAFLDPGALPTRVSRSWPHALVATRATPARWVTWWECFTGMFCDPKTPVWPHEIGRKCTGSLVRGLLKRQLLGFASAWTRSMTHQLTANQAMTALDSRRPRVTLRDALEAAQGESCVFVGLTEMTEKWDLSIGLFHQMFG